jgi:hypothetical protein
MWNSLLLSLDASSIHCLAVAVEEGSIADESTPKTEAEGISLSLLLAPSVALAPDVSTEEVWGAEVMAAEDSGVADVLIKSAEEDNAAV